MLWSTVVTLIALAIGAFLIAAYLSPLESLGWWAGWQAKRGDPRARVERPPLVVARPEIEHWLVYLSGVGRLSGQVRPPKEENFLDLVEAKTPHVAIVRDVFPFSPTNTPLTEDRPLAGFWRFIPIIAQRLRPGRYLWQFIFIRNLLQVAVSADRRYGPLYNYGVAREIVRSLLRSGYPIGSGRPVWLMCISGGGQVSAGVAPFLRRWIGAPVFILSIGGIFSSDPGLLAVEHFFHLAGSLDLAQYLGATLFPGRWPLARGSAWNRLRRNDRVTVIDVGPMKHMGQGDYFSRSARLETGESHVEHTAAVVSRILAQATLHA